MLKEQKIRKYCLEIFHIRKLFVTKILSTCKFYERNWLMRFKRPENPGGELTFSISPHWKRQPNRWTSNFLSPANKRGIFFRFISVNKSASHKILHPIITSMYMSLGARRENLINVPLQLHLNGHLNDPRCRNNLLVRLGVLVSESSYVMYLYWICHRCLCTWFIYLYIFSTYI